MKLSVFAVLLKDRPFDEACKYLAEAGVQQVEIGCGGYPGKEHCDPEVLLHDDKQAGGVQKHPQEVQPDHSRV